MLRERHIEILSGHDMLKINRLIAFTTGCDSYYKFTFSAMSVTVLLSVLFPLPSCIHFYGIKTLMLSNNDASST